MKAPIIQENEWKFIKLSFQIVEAAKIKPNISE